MNFYAGIRFIVFLIIFGVTNYLMMLRRYENDIKKKKYLQKKRVEVKKKRGELKKSRKKEKTYQI